MKVSVIVTNYNYGRFLGRCLRSILDQSLSNQDYEVIVVDDGSTDESIDVLQDYKDNVRLIQQENQGVSTASNVGVRAALAPYVVRIDADDYINKHFLLTLIQFLDWNPELAFVFCDHLVVKETGEILKRVSLAPLETLLDHGAGVLLRKSYLEAVGLYDENLRNREDYDLLLRLIRTFPGLHVRLPLYRYCTHGPSLSKNLEERERIATELRDKYGINSDLPPSEAEYHELE